MCKNQPFNNNSEHTSSELRVSSILAYVMLLLCVLGIICPFIFQAYNHRSEKVIVVISQEDTLPISTNIKSIELDSLLQLIEKKEMRLEERYDYVLEQKENEFKWQSYISLIIGIIVSICGFFGYKSIRELKEDVQKDTKSLAERVAKAKATQTAEEIAKNESKIQVQNSLPNEVRKYLAENLRPELSKQMNELFRDEMYNSLKSELVEKINDKFSQISKTQNALTSNSTENVDPILPEDNENNGLFNNK